MAKVIKVFRDKETKKIYTPGDAKTGVYDGTEKRIKELQAKGFLEKAKEVKTPKKKGD